MANQRPPKDLNGLLKFCLSTTAREDAPHASEAQTLDEERKQWLRSALRSMTTDTVEQMIQELDVLRKNVSVLTEEASSECVAAIEHITDIVQSGDVANDFQKIGGLEVLLICLSSPFATIRRQSANLIAEVCQNNPHCQNEVLKLQIFPTLLKMVDVDADNETRVKALYALSCIVRNNDSAVDLLLAADSFSVFIRAMQSDIDKLKVKTVFLITSLISQHPQIKNALLDVGFVEQLVGLIQREHDNTHEHILGALVALVKDSNYAVDECRRKELNLRQILINRLGEINGKEEFIEEAEYCQTLLQLCFSPILRSALR